MTFRDGWRDFMSAAPWPRAYDGWQAKQQLEYESGRRAAATYRGTINKSPRRCPPPWQMPEAARRPVHDERRFTYQTR